MSTVQLRYIGGLEYVDVPLLQREGEPLEEHGTGCLVRGEVFTCDKKHAGRAPKLAADGALELGDDGQPVDAGEGLLAQPSNFELATGESSQTKVAKRARRPRKTASAKKPDRSPPMPAASPASDETPEA